MSEPESFEYEVSLERLVAFRKAAMEGTKDDLLETAKRFLESLDGLQAEFLDVIKRSAYTILAVAYCLAALQKKCKSDGSWVEFYQTHLPNLSKTTIYRYLALAEAFPDPTKVPRDLRVTEAYRLAGIVPAKKLASSRHSGDEAFENDGGCETSPFNVFAFQKQVGDLAKMCRALVEARAATGISLEDRRAMLRDVNELMAVIQTIHLSLASHS